MRRAAAVSKATHAWLRTTAVTGPIVLKLLPLPLSQGLEVVAATAAESGEIVQHKRSSIFPTT